MEERGRSKTTAFLTRYEIVAVAVPGAVFLFGVWYFTTAPQLSGEITKIELGALGLFTIAALCAGQVIQAIGMAFEALALWLDPTGRVSSENDVPTFVRVRYARPLKGLHGFNAQCMKAFSRRDYRRDLFPFLMAHLYRVGITDRLADLRVSWGLHRGLAVAFYLLYNFYAVYGRHQSVVWYVALLFCAAVMMAMTVRYRRQFYRQVAYEYMDLES